MRMISAINSLSTPVKRSSNRPKLEANDRVSVRPSTGERKIFKRQAPSINRSKILAKIQQREQEKQLKNQSSPENKALKVVQPETDLLDGKDPEVTKEKLRTVLTGGGFHFNEKEKNVLSQILNK